MVMLEKMALREITSANYITPVNGMVHPDRIMDEHDFLYILDGEWEVWEEGTPYSLVQDDLLILAAGRHHYGKKLCNPGNRHMYFHVKPTEQECLSPQSVSPSLFSCHTLVHCQDHPHIRQYFQDLISAYWSSRTERENRLSLLFNMILCEISELFSCKSRITPTDSLVEEVEQQIRSHPQIFYTSEEMAACHFICARTLNNHFLKSFQKTFYAFQMETHLEMVRHFLIYQPKATLREAALNFGFYDEFHLSKAFKKRYGISPSRFREHL